MGTSVLRCALHHIRAVLKRKGITGRLTINTREFREVLDFFFDHDEEEERELSAFDGIPLSPKNKPNMNMIELRR